MFSFYKNRYKFLILSLVALVAGIIVLAIFGLNLDIENVEEYLKKILRDK